MLEPHVICDMANAAGQEHNDVIYQIIHTIDWLLDDYEPQGTKELE